MPDTDTDNGALGLPDLQSDEITERNPGFLHIAEKEQPDEAPTSTTPSAEAKPVAPPSPPHTQRVGTIEHLAARRAFPELDADAPEIKEQLVTLRPTITRLLTSLRWEGMPVDKIAEQMVPLLNVGSVQQWRPILLPFLLEIDRAGNLTPVWQHIIEQGDPAGLPHNANPAETPQGCARRFAILMLGYYKSYEPSQQKVLGFAKGGADNRNLTNNVQLLGRLSVDPNTSMYAAQSLAMLGTTLALRTLVSALKDAEGWAKVDIVEAILSLKLEEFYDLVLASGLERVPGLESYISVPVYRTIPLERYLRGSSTINQRLTQQAALVFSAILQDAIHPPKGEVLTLPIVFEQKLPLLAEALFTGARSHPMWQNTVAVHRLATFLGRYWSSISRAELKDTRIVEAIYNCLPMMPEVERWMAGPGRDVLLTALSERNEEALPLTVKAIGELHEPRATAPLMQYLSSITTLTGQAQALTLGAVCDTLGQLGDRRASQLLQQLLLRTVDIERRKNQAKRRDNLPTGDTDIPGSIIYAAVARAYGQLADRSALDLVLRAAQDFDPYVRTQALEAIRRMDPTGEDPRSRLAAREALNDPKDTVIRAANQQVLQYRDINAISSLRNLMETRPELAAAAYDTLRQLGQ
ncbi:MAG: HEAT repeat domain-containing protein [Chloroflexi bacterium]|nr:MAG: HEAT repeat domain-containing protein [Chloroflexota bacterium]